MVTNDDAEMQEGTRNHTEEAKARRGERVSVCAAY